MAISASDLTAAPNGNADHIVTHDGQQLPSDGSLLTDYSCSAMYHAEPIFAVGDENIQGYENYKYADQYSGHAFKSSEPALTDSANGESYVVEEEGKSYQSGKTYFLGWKTIIVPYYNDTSNN